MTIDTTNRRHWRDVEAAAKALEQRPADRRTLLLLATLPLLSEEVIQRLAGLRGGASVYRGLRRLADDGLIAAVRPSLQAGHGPRLWYLTDLGLAVVALDQGVEPEPLARRNRLRGADLLALLPGLPQLQAGYELLAALAASRPGPPNLLAWERPWRRRYQRPTAKAPVAATLPAYAALAWEGRAGAYLLLPDRGTAPLRLYAPALDHLLVLRGVQAGELPTLVIATTDPGRATAWRALLEEARRARSEAPLAACIATWDDLRQRPETLADP
ncbi:MAG TPA: replication-relaxation family protein, partial [Candidatus Dormibacteraeota bacterium]|nr:replication-relaxation family protein [Candidatus Dormibacteraeota bacterium]